LTIPGTPFKLSKTPGEIRLLPPSLGNGNDEILQDIGMTSGQIEELYNKSIIFKKIKDE